MTSFELLEIVNQRLDDPTVLGRLATNLFSEASVHQRHKDDRTLTLAWQEHGDMWRAIGDYHSHTMWLSTPYKLKVMAEAMKLPQGPTVQKPHRRKHRKPEDLASD